MTEFKTLQEFESIYDSIKTAQENTSESFVWLSGVCHPLLNSVMHLREVNDWEAKIDALLSQIAENIPISFWVSPQEESTGLVPALKERGFHLIITCSLMACLTREIPTSSNEIYPADSVIFHRILAEAFHFDPKASNAYKELMQNDNTENFLIYDNGQPVGTGTLVSNDENGGIFNLAIRPEFQKKGRARAMMEFLMQRAFEKGLKKLVLLSSPEAKRLYSRLGFANSMDLGIYTLHHPI